MHVVTGDRRRKQGGGRQLCVGIYHDPRQSRDMEVVGFAGGQGPCFIFLLSQYAAEYLALGRSLM